MSLTDYEKYHLHDDVYSMTEIDNDIYKKTDIDTKHGQHTIAINSNSQLIGTINTQIPDFVKKDGSVKMTGNLDMNSNGIINAADPINANDVCNKGYTDGLIPKKIFYRGKCHHNNDQKVKFYSNGTLQHATNVKQSHNNDFVSSLSSNTKLLIKNKGTYILSFWDGIKSNRTGYLNLKMDKYSLSVAGGTVKFPTQNTNKSWATFQFTTVLEVADNTNLEMEVNNNNIMLDGLSYSYLTIYKIM